MKRKSLTQGSWELSGEGNKKMLQADEGPFLKNKGKVLNELRKWQSLLGLEWEVGLRDGLKFIMLRRESYSVIPGVFKCF